MEWQPIESAPKDGTQVIIALNGIALVSHYDCVERIRNGKTEFKYEAWSLPLHLALERDASPTHWMPIPKVPA